MIPLPQKPKIIKKEENKALFKIEGLYPGYGSTIGNSLRRVLLSSLEGAAITQVKIKDVAHEFSAIPGVLEDVVIILLNLKRIRFKMYGSEPRRGTLKVKGEKEVKASDFVLPSQIEIMNKDTHIATLTGKKSCLEMEIQVEKGVGYEPVEERKKEKSEKSEKSEIGVIDIDAIYGPIKKVSPRVEDMRVGERTDFDRLFLEIETDGTISPESAFGDACNILREHIALLLEDFQKKEKIQLQGEKKEKPEKRAVAKKTTKAKKKGKKEVEKDILKKEITEIGLSGRTSSVLAENKVKTVAGLIKKNEKSIVGIKGMGETGLKEIKKAIKKLDLNLKN